MTVQQSEALAMWAPLGAASPLWAAYIGAASAGMAFWWMTRSMQPAHLDVLFGRKAEVKAIEHKPASHGLSPTAKALIARRKTVAAAKAPKAAPTA